MKRKIFSKLLMGALLVASVSSFVSCKDYDDDINNLQDQINAKAAASQIESLQSQLTGISSTASSALAKAEAAATAAAAAQNTADKAATQAALDAVKATAEKAGTDAAKAINDAAAAAAAAKSEADAAKAAGEAAAKAAQEAAEKAIAEAIAKVPVYDLTPYATKAELEGLASKDDLKGYATTADVAKAVADATKDVATTAALNKALEDLKADLEKQIADAKAAMSQASATQGAVDQLWANAVSSIELAYAVNQVNKTNLYFFQGEQIVNYTFGKEYESSELPASQYQEYKKGDDIIFRNNVIVRVNPVTAELKAENVKLINSLGQNLDEIVKIQKVERYNDLLTRAGETGLWQITFARQESATDAQFAKATKGATITEENTTARGKALYAIAVNNTTDATADRFAVTSYNFNIWYGEYDNANSLYFTVEGTWWGNLHNRWNGSKVIAEDETKASEPADYQWNWRGPAALPVVKTGSTANVSNDSRYARTTYINAEVNEPFKIAGIQENFIDYYYVVLDYDCAIESSPSELRAWQSYVIEGINEKVESGKDLNITITDKGADAEGDIVGFRVFGVNYDGTLADPDGVAFYVQVGSAKVWEPVVKGAATAFNPTTISSGVAGVTNAQITNKENLAIFACDFKEFGLANDITLTAAGFPSTVTIPTGGDNDASVAVATFAEVRYLTSDAANMRGEYPTATRVNDVKFVAIRVDAPEDIVDNSTFVTTTTDITNPDNHGKKVGELMFQLKKGAVATANWNYDNNGKFAWLNDYQPDASGIVTLYPSPTTGWTFAGGWAPAAVLPATANLTVDLLSFAQNLWTGSATAGEHYIDFNNTFGDYFDWISIAAAEVSPSAILGYTLNTRYAENTSRRIGGGWRAQDFDGSEFLVRNDMLGDKCARDNQKHVVSMYIEAEGTGPMISRTFKSGYSWDAVNNTNAPSTPNYPVVSQTLAFDDVMKYETYSTALTYKDNTGALGANSDAKNDVTKNNYLWVSWNKLAAASNIHVYYADYVPGPANAWTKAAGAQWTAATQVPSAMAMLNKAENTAVKSFGPAAFDDSYYVVIAATDMQVISPNGAIDEYVKVDGASTVANIKLVKATGTMPKANMNMKLRMKCTDVLGVEHNVDIPFVLNVTE